MGRNRNRNEAPASFARDVAGVAERHGLVLKAILFFIAALFGAGVGYQAWFSALAKRAEVDEAVAKVRAGIEEEVERGRGRELRITTLEADGRWIKLTLASISQRVGAVPVPYPPPSADAGAP